MEVRNCPHCGSSEIVLKSETLTSYEFRENKIKVCMCCKNCNHRGLSAFGRFTNEEAFREAVKLWNNV